MAGMASKGSKAKAIREFKSSGNKAMASGAFQKAARQYTKALELDPGNAILYSNRSAAHFNLRQFSESLEDAESAILCDNMWWKAYKRKGLSLIHMQRYEEAIEALEEGLKIVKQNAEMEKNLEFARACQEQAQNLYILPEPHMMQRLESVPVFIVTDDVGQPFFVTYEDGQQVCTFYFDKTDANSTLDWIKSENPDLGDTARVIHITLNQAFNLAQETQKQYYDETTRAAVEEDRRAAEAAAKKGEIENAADIDGSDEDKEVTVKETVSDDAVIIEEITTEAETKPEAESVNMESKAADAETEKGDANESKPASDAEKKEGTNEDNFDDAIDENAPLSFQFRPELRQVQIAVELLNKHPDPPVKPILRDPPSVRKAKAEAAAAAAAAATAGDKAESADADAERKNYGTGDKIISEEPTAQGNVETNKAETAAEADQSEVAKEAEKKEGAMDAGKDVTEDKMTNVAGEDETKKESTESNVDTAKGVAESKDETEKKDSAKLIEDDEDAELTVDNFNGIPVFQAKGLTLLQNNEQLIPLFFSKWDLEAAWKQLAQSNAADVPGECEIDVGTLEDVLRRMSESKTKEFESVFFVPSREAMQEIGAKFPLDDLTATKPMVKPAVKKAAFSKAKQIAARGGTKDEVRAAIREDLELAVERQRMAEIIAQIEQARRLGGTAVSGMSQEARRRSGRIDRTMRRNAQRLERKQAARTAGKTSLGQKGAKNQNNSSKIAEKEEQEPKAEEESKLQDKPEEDQAPSVQVNNSAVTSQGNVKVVAS